MFESEPTLNRFSARLMFRMEGSDEYGRRLIEETRQLVATTKARIVSARETHPADPAYIENIKKVLAVQEELLARFESGEIVFRVSLRIAWLNQRVALRRQV